MKIDYSPVSADIHALQGGKEILVGSLTTVPITIPKKNVSVESFEDDETFVDEGFGDISF